MQWLGPIRWPLSEVDCSVAKISKVKLPDLVEKDVNLYKAIPNDAVWMIGLMALLQALEYLPDTFRD